MELQEATFLGLQLIISKDKHPDYDRTVALAEKYLVLSTGEGIEKMLRRFVKREEESDFKERCNLTKAITPAVTESLEKPWNKVIRNERIKKSVELKNKANDAKVGMMLDSFFGSDRSSKAVKGLDYWMKTRLFELTFADPNAWIAVEWLAVAPNEIIKPHPFEIPSKNALNFSIINDETKWLFCRQDIKMKTSPKPEGKLADGTRYTLYEQSFTVVYEQVDFRYWSTNPFELAPNQEFQKIGNLGFIISWYEPKVGFAPVFRVGYKTDRATNSRTFVNPWHKALAYLEKSLKTVSELDLTMTLHSFPQKLQYAYKCNGPSRDERCNKGLLKDDSECPSCKGTGYKFHTSANDAIILAMPEDPIQSDMVDLDKLIVYKSPPVDLIRWQNEYILQLKGECSEAVFTQIGGSQKASGPSGDSGNGQPGNAATATEIQTNMQGVYDALEPFTEKYSELYREFVTVFGILAGERIEDVKVVHNFPADFKLKTTDILLEDLKNVNASSAPSFLRDAINMDLAENVYSGDDLGLLKYRTKRKYFPFNGKATDEIQYLMASPIVAEREKILYANFESIFQEIESETPEFYFIKKPEAQYQVVEDKIQEWRVALEAEKPPAPVLGRIGGEGGIGNQDPPPED